VTKPFVLHDVTSFNCVTQDKYVTDES